MKKRVLSLLLILSLLLSTMGIVFADDFTITGYSNLNPVPFNTEMRLNDVKTQNGSWKNVSIKVTEMKVDNSGYQSALISNGLKVNKEDATKYDALKVKVNYTFNGFTGNNNSLIKDSLFVKSIMAMQAGAVDQEKGQLYSKFPNALNNIVEKYSVGGKVIKGAWADKKIKDVNFSKPTSMSGYVYVIVEKGKTTNVLANFELYPQKKSELSNVYIGMTKEVTASKIKETGSYMYGNSKVGMFSSPFELKQHKAGKENELHYLYNGESNDTTKGSLYVDIVGFDLTGEFANKGDEKAAEWAKQVSDTLKLNAVQEGNVYSIIGLSSESERYNNVHVFNTDNKLILVMFYSAPCEKEKVDKLWASYKSSNDISKKTSDSNKGTADTASPAKDTSKKPLGKYEYGMGQYGTFSSLEELVQSSGSETAIMKFNSKSGDSFYTLQYFGNGQMNVEGLDKNIKKMFPDSVVGKLDNGNITVYSDNSYTYDCATVLLVSKNNQINTFIIGLPKKAQAQKEIVIKSYLMSLGYTEEQAETLSTSAIFD